MATVERTNHLVGSRQGLTTLEQRFRFGGDGANAAAVAGVMLTAPLTGGDSVFGDRPGEEGPRADSSRTLRGFSPLLRLSLDRDARRPGPSYLVEVVDRNPGTTPYFKSLLDRIEIVVPEGLDETDPIPHFATLYAATLESHV
jgi:hypothetical protein